MIRLTKFEVIAFIMLIVSFFIQLTPIANIPKSIIYTILSSIVIVYSLYNCTIHEDLFSMISIANAFLGFVFVARAIQIFLNYPNFEDIHSIRLYQNIFGYYSIDNLPFDRASLIGLVGILSLNVAYNRVCCYKSRELNKKLLISSKYTSKEFIGIALCLIPALLSMMSFLVKSIISSDHISLYDLTWLYIFSVIIIYIINKKGSANFLIYLIIGTSIVLLSVVAKRQYIVNLLLCYIIPLYYSGYSKKSILKVMLMSVGIFLVVLFYGQIRAEMISAKTGTVISQLMTEFCMYDMLVVSIKRLEDISYGYFWGYNFLTIITTPISKIIGINISQFDHELTNIVFNGVFRGGIPVTIMGSLYLNFSFVGVVFGSLILGYLFAIINNKFSSKYKRNDMMYYVIFATFSYDIIRVGDIGREFWTLCVGLFVVYMFSLIVPDKRS